MSNSTDPNAIITGFNEKLRSQWEQHRRQAFNSNTKGAVFENTLQEFLLDYFEGVYDVRTRTVVIDEYLKCFEVFNSGNSEFDVVTSFKQSVPRMIFKSNEMTWVPYDGVAFVAEVKSEINTSKLESDLEKFAKLTQIEPDSQYSRFPRGTAVTRMYIEPEPGKKGYKKKVHVNHQLKCLVYDSASISDSSLRKRLGVDTEIWDLLLIVDENILYVSPELPFSDVWKHRGVKTSNVEVSKEMWPDIISLDDGLVWFILLLSISIPRPAPFDVTPALLHLVQRNWDEFGNYFGWKFLD